MSEFETVQYSVEAGIATITLNRPDSLNAFNAALRRDMLLAINSANNDPAVRVVIVTGAGRGFCAGADLQDPLGKFNSVKDMIIEEYKPIMLGISGADKLYISAVNGPCAGIGSALAMNCDLMVMADNAYIYQAFAAIGLIPDGGANWHLFNTLGYKRALEFVVDAGKMPAEDCVKYGLANKVVPAAELMTETRAWAQRLAAGSPLAQKFSKRILQSAQNMTLSEVIDHEAHMQNTTFESEDFKNAKEAFFKKEKPVFRGC